ncbi:MULTISPECIES: recombination regulator RecX [Legionella]|uniref:Regulatory protein RecX n=1 Tax=Legionella septentrionalis TaxID=2498109 RepID=A0A3S0V5U1_9GAMM|nr:MULTISPECIES: recombination regulator RecX [Legionella]MCP0914268.1 recombination regulator RecX [Legionella sp. 27cVA30]RUQ89197.1 recombination regulator RecX [Legionella septentrionalis]RUR00603.1 recombination regulator RecX [Legionella septentrionalis]RUR11770.1 recombination regulator RecX [Legionella septentrionalis]RUR17458.1 recombination regulator RecX [Legionella septentrionalis]
MNKPFSHAIRLLAKREYGAHELEFKLAQKGYDAAQIEATLVKCQHLGLQSDERYAASVCRTRIAQGYGPLRIRQELLSQQVNADLIEETLQQEDENWLSYALAVHQKKYKEKSELSFAQLQKQKQFLFYRGFPSHIIAKVFNDEFAQHEQ